MRLTSVFLLAVLLAVATSCEDSNSLPGNISEAGSTPGELQLLDGTRRPIVGAKRQATLLAFWSTSCVNCVAEIPALAQLHQSQGDDGIEVIGVNSGDTSRRIKAFLNDRPVPYPIAVDRDQSLAQRFDVQTVPRLILIDRFGKTRFDDHQLPQDLSELTQRLSRPTGETLARGR